MLLEAPACQERTFLEGCAFGIAQESGGTGQSHLLPPPHHVYHHIYITASLGGLIWPTTNGERLSTNLVFSGIWKDSYSGMFLIADEWNTSSLCASIRQLFSPVHAPNATAFE